MEECELLLEGEKEGENGAGGVVEDVVEKESGGNENTVAVVELEDELVDQTEPKIKDESVIIIEADDTIVLDDDEDEIGAVQTQGVDAGVNLKSEPESVVNEETELAATGLKEKPASGGVDGQSEMSVIYVKDGDDNNNNLEDNNNFIYTEAFCQDEYMGRNQRSKDDSKKRDPGSSLFLNYVFFF